MELEEGKESMFTAETSSGAVSSKKQTPKPLKAKPKIAKNAAVNSATSTTEMKNTPVQGRKKVVKKKTVVTRKSVNNMKEDVLKANSVDVENKNVLSGEQGGNNQENLKNNSVPGSEKINDMNDTTHAQNLNGEKLKEEENKNVPSGEQGKHNHENLKNKSIPESEKINDMNDTADAQNLNGEKFKDEVIRGENINSNPGNLKRKKKVIVVRKKIKKCNKEGSEVLNKEESQSGISAEKSKKRPEIGKDKVRNKEGSKALNEEKSQSGISAEKSKKWPGIGKDKVPSHEKNTENFDGSRNKRLKQNVEDRNGLSRKQNDQKNKEKLSGSVGNEQRIKKEVKKHQLEGECKEQRNKKLGGLILFCNGKTKSDCFRYHIMGVSAGRKDIVLDIKPGLKLFLYDFDIKLLYGIYSASSPGGTKLEPAAFNGSFPFQVRFEVYKDCYPLPESVFKRAIKENYGSNNKFDQELTSQQVNKLMELFKPTEVKQHALPLYPPKPVSVEKGEAKEIEAEYLAHHRREPLAREPYTYDERRGYDLHLNKNDEHSAYRPAPSAQREASPEQLFLSEKDYRTYGLRREKRNISPPRSHITPTLGLNSRTQEYHTPYSHFPKQEPHSSVAHISDSTASIVDSYLKVPYYASSKDPYHLPPRAERDEVPLGSYSLGRRETAYQPESSYLLRGENHPNQRNYIMEASEGRREKDEAGALYSSYDSKAHSEHNQLHMIGRAKPETSSLGPVSARYLVRGENHPSQRNYIMEASEGRRREKDEAGALYSSYASKAHSEHNQLHMIERAKPETSSLGPVSARYSFSGPSGRYL